MKKDVRKMLLVLPENEDFRASDISRLIGFKGGHMGMTLKEMYEIGYITREKKGWTYVYHMTALGREMKRKEMKK